MSDNSNRLRTGMRGILFQGGENPAAAENTGPDTEMKVSVPSRVPLVGVGRPRKGENKWDRERNFITSIAFDRRRYDRVAEIAYEEKISRKEAIDRLLIAGIAAYENDHSIMH